MKSLGLIIICGLFTLPFVKVNTMPEFAVKQNDSIMCVGRLTAKNYKTAYEQEKDYLLDNIHLVGNPDCSITIENRQYRISPIKVEKMQFTRCESDRCLATW